VHVLQLHFVPGKNIKRFLVETRAAVFCVLQTPGHLILEVFLLDLIMIQYFFKEHALAEYDSASSGSEPSERSGLLGNKEQPDVS